MREEEEERESERKKTIGWPAAIKLPILLLLLPRNTLNDTSDAQHVCCDVDTHARARSGFSSDSPGGCGEHTRGEKKMIVDLLLYLMRIDKFSSFWSARREKKVRSRRKCLEGSSSGEILYIYKHEESER